MNHPLIQQQAEAPLSIHLPAFYAFLLPTLLPYVARYRGRALLALVALVVAALTTLVVPVAVRRMIDFGFNAHGLALINNYFSLMIAVVAVLAVAGGLEP